VRIWGLSRAPVHGRSFKLKAFWQSLAVFLLKDLAFYNIFHVRMLFQKGMWPYWPLHV